jgi:hypothetical protein
MRSRQKIASSRMSAFARSFTTAGTISFPPISDNSRRAWARTGVANEPVAILANSFETASFFGSPVSLLPTGLQRRFADARLGTARNASEFRQHAGILLAR